MKQNNPDRSPTPENVLILQTTSTHKAFDRKRSRSKDPLDIKELSKPKMAKINDENKCDENIIYTSKDENFNHVNLISKEVVKRGRGRPPKSLSSSKINITKVVKRGKPSKSNLVKSKLAYSSLISTIAY
jgi:hypothetical protein